MNVRAYKSLSGIRTLRSAARKLDRLGYARDANRLDTALRRLAYGYDEEEDGDGETINASDEFWLDDGAATYANGDIGDDNHESIADRHMSYLIDPKNEFDRHYEGMNSSAREEIFNERVTETSREMELRGLKNARGLHDHGDTWLRYVIGLYRKYRHQWSSFADIHDYLEMVHDAEMPHDATDAQRQQAAQKFKDLREGFRDVRQYAKKHLGWHAVRGSYVEVYKLDQKTEADLYQGLSDAYPNARKASFNIEVEYPVKHMLYDVTFEDMADGSLLQRSKMTIGKILRERDLAEQARRKSNPEPVSAPDANSQLALDFSAPPAPVNPNVNPNQNLDVLYDPRQRARGLQDQMRGVPGYKPQGYDQTSVNGPRKEDGSPVYKSFGD